MILSYMTVKWSKADFIIRCHHECKLVYPNTERREDSLREKIVSYTTVNPNMLQTSHTKSKMYDVPKCGIF